MSISNDMVSYVTLFRNPNGREEEWVFLTNQLERDCFNPARVAIAEVFYILIIPFAIAETALAAIAKLFTMFLPIGECNHMTISEWLKDSAFAIVWAACNCFLNLVACNLVTHNSIAQEMLANYNICEVPVESCRSYRRQGT